MNLYVIYDRVAEESGPVYEAKNDGVASRMYAEFLRKITARPEDYLLLRVGTIDHRTSLVTGEPVPVETVPAVVAR